MHELSLMEEVLTLLEASAREEGFTRVRRIILRIGALSGVEPETLAFCFESVMAGTLAEGAELELRAVAGAGWCATCQASVSLETRFDPCPRCGRGQLPVLSGSDLRVEALDVT